jgi:hypothetical protein
MYLLRAVMKEVTIALQFQGGASADNHLLT